MITYLCPDRLSTQITGLTMYGQSPSLSRYIHTQRRKFHTIQTFSSIFYIITSCAVYHVPTLLTSEKSGTDKTY